MAERSVKESLKSVKFFVYSCVAIARSKYPDDKIRGEVIENGNEASVIKEQIPELKTLIPLFMNILADIPGGNSDQELWKNFVWKEKEENSFLDLLGLVVSFPDLHHQKVHATLIPERKQVTDYIEAVTANREGNISLEEQFSLALSLTNNSPISAVFLAFIGSRMLARRMDKTLYEEEIEITDEVLKDFKKNIASFFQAIQETEPDKNFAYYLYQLFNFFMDGKLLEADKKAEDPGDTYYFWTSCLMGIVLRFMDDKKPIRTRLIVKPFYRSGITAMMIGRAKFAQQPNYSSHRIPEQMGFDVGWALADEVLAGEKEEFEA